MVSGKKIFSSFSFVCFCSIFPMLSQSENKKVQFSAYNELYFSYDFRQTGKSVKPGFIYNHKRNSTLANNLLLASAKYSDDKVRANVALMLGDYATYNLAAEPTWAKVLNEAHIGLLLSKKSNTWLDVGLLPSHIGIESAIGFDNWTLTRSLLAENSPYFETGIKLSGQAMQKKMMISALILNGWQKIKRPNYIKKPSYGLQLQYKPSAKHLLNYSNFIGTDKPDSVAGIRHFHNFYAQFEPSASFGLQLGMDMGFEKNRKNKYATWFAPMLVIQQKLGEKINLAGRIEYYSDKTEAIINTSQGIGFQTLGLSSNIDFTFSEKIKCRLEAKKYYAKQAVFVDNTAKDYFILTSSVCLKL